MPPDGIEALVWFWSVPLFVSLWTLPVECTEASAGTHSGKGRAFGRLRVRAALRSQAVRGATLGFVAGFTFFLANLSWLLELRHIIGSLTFALIGLLALSSYLGLFFAAWGAFVSTVGRPSSSDFAPDPTKDRQGRTAELPGRRGSQISGRRDAKGSGAEGSLMGTSFTSLRFALLNAAAWTGLEWIRGWLLTGFGWNGLGVALHANPTLIQIADIVGVAGLSFLPVFVTGILLHTLWRIHLEASSRRLRPHLDFMAAILLVICVFFYGVEKVAVASSRDSVELRTLLVQPNIPQSLKWDPEAALDIYRTLDDLTRLNVEIHPFDLVIWPEASLPLHLDHPEHALYLERILALGDHSLLLGTNVFAPRQTGNQAGSIQRIYNSAALMRDRVADAQIHHKMHLVPFGEFLPLRKVFPLVERIFGELLPADFDRGRSTEPLILELPGEDKGSDILLSPLICFEDTVPRVVRRLVRSGAPQVLVNLTNDGWFGESRASHQHLVNASFRCIELRRPMIRCANNGVSCIIDTSGSFYDREAGDGFRRLIEDPDAGNSFIRGTLPATLKIDPDPPITFYARFGDAFSVLCTLSAMAAVLHALSARQWRAKGDLQQTRTD